MTRHLTEAEFQTQVIDLARLMGWRCAHFRAARTNRGWRTPCVADAVGWPDLVLVHPVRRRVIFVELKADGGHLSPSQAEWLAALRDAGADARLWTPGHWDEIERVLTNK